MPPTASIPIQVNGSHAESEVRRGRPQSQGPAVAGRGASLYPCPDPTRSDSSVSSVFSVVKNSALTDDYLCAELSPRALAQRHNISLEQLLDHFADEQPAPAPASAEGFDEIAVPRSDFRVPRSGAASLLARLEAFSLRRAKVIGALMRPQVLHNLFECMQAAQVGTDTHRRACTTLLRAIDAHTRPPPPVGEGGESASRERDTPRPHPRNARPQPPPTRHRMKEFFSDTATPPNGSPIPESPDEASVPCPLCGRPWTARREPACNQPEVLNRESAESPTRRGGTDLTLHESSESEISNLESEPPSPATSVETSVFNSGPSGCPTQVDSSVPSVFSVVKTSPEPRAPT